MTKTMLSLEDRKMIDALVRAAEKRVRQAYWSPVLGLIPAILVLCVAVFGLTSLESKMHPLLETAWGGTSNLADLPVTHRDLRSYAELQSSLTVNRIMMMIVQIVAGLSVLVSIWRGFTMRPEAQRELAKLRALQIVLAHCEVYLNRGTEHHAGHVSPEAARNASSDEPTA